MHEEAKIFHPFALPATCLVACGTCIVLDDALDILRVMRAVVRLVFPSGELLVLSAVQAFLKLAHK